MIERRRRLSISLLVGAVVCLPGHARAQAFADRVVAYQIGTEGGAGSDKMPGIVLGPPHGGGAFRGSTDTLSLGLGGWIIVEFTEGWIVDGPGADFTVFENPFLVTGLVTYPPFAEPGTVSVSADGAEWHTFPCHLDAPPYYPGCAGVYPVFANADDPAAPSPFVPCSVPIQALVGVPVSTFSPPACSGGDSFDLADLGLPAARFVRIDASQLEPGLGGTAGFDLDAMAAIHFATSPSTSMPCMLSQIPEDSLTGVECAIDVVGRTLNEPPQPTCTCKRCSLQPGVDRLAGLVMRAEAATSAKTCKQRLGKARRVAKALSARVAALTRRRCLAPADRAPSLHAEVADLARRTTALFKSPFCAAR